MTRAERAAATLRRHAELLGDPNAEDQTAAADLLTDLMHLADGGSLDFAGALLLARMNYEAEQEEEGHGD